MTLVPASNCPYCEELLDAAGMIEAKDVQPSPGNASICAYCAQMLIFDDNLLLRKPRSGEIATMNRAFPEAMAKIEFIQRVVRAMDRRDIHARRKTNKPSG